MKWHIMIWWMVCWTASWRKYLILSGFFLFNGVVIRKVTRNHDKAFKQMIYVCAVCTWSSNGSLSCIQMSLFLLTLCNFHILLVTHIFKHVRSSLCCFFKISKWESKLTRKDSATSKRLREEMEYVDTGLKLNFLYPDASLYRIEMGGILPRNNA